MYAKLFKSIYDGSLRRDWKAMVVFQQLCILSDTDGFVDMTPDAIAARTGIPLDFIQYGISVLEKPDPDSRSKEAEGRRIVLVDQHRSWGWRIVNKAYYRTIYNQEDLRTYWAGKKQELRTAQRMRSGRPTSVEEVISYGATINPKVSEKQCRKFWDFYESQAKTSPNGELYWITSGGAVITNWRTKLPSFGYEQGSRQNGQSNDHRAERRAKEYSQTIRVKPL